MNENDKEVLINFVKYNKFYKDEKDGRLIMSINIGAKEMLDKSIKKIIEKHEETESDLYEANNRIVDLMDIIEERDKIIDLMAKALKFVSINDNNKYIHFNDTESIKKYFEERCK